MTFSKQILDDGADKYHFIKDGKKQSVARDRYKSQIIFIF